MSYKDRHGHTVIKDSKRNHLYLVIDNMGDGPIPVLTHTPWMEDINHYHIELTQPEAKILRDWLTAYLDEHEE